MNKCRNPDHPHCTHWVMQGADACTGGHAQPQARHDAAAVAPPTSSGAAPAAALAPDTPAEDASAGMLADAHVTKILPRPAVERMAYCAVKN